MPKSIKGRPVHWPVGFGRDPRTGIFRLKHGNSTESLRTRDEFEALSIYRLVMEAAPDEVAERSLFPAYIKMFVNDVLPTLLALRGPREGQPLAEDSKAELRRALLHPALHDEDGPLCVPIESVDETRIRQALAPWLTKPRMYNSVRNALSRVLAHARDEGMEVTNTVRDVDPRKVPKRSKSKFGYLDDGVFSTILAHLTDDWQRVAFTLAYLLGCRPGELVEIAERDIDDVGITYTAKKTGDRVCIVWDDELHALVDWQRQWKRDQRLVSSMLICTPVTMMVRHPTRGLVARRSRVNAGKPLPRDWLTKAFRRAAAEAGHPGWAPRDIRPKGLTDEATARGEHQTRKGGQRSEAVRQGYVRKRIDVQEFNSLKAVLPGILGEPDEKVVSLANRRKG